MRPHLKIIVLCISMIMIACAEREKVNALKITDPVIDEKSQEIIDKIEMDYKMSIFITTDQILEGFRESEDSLLLVYGTEDSTLIVYFYDLATRQEIGLFKASAVNEDSITYYAGYGQYVTVKIGARKIYSVIETDSGYVFARSYLESDDPFSFRNLGTDVYFIGPDFTEKNRIRFDLANTKFSNWFQSSIIMEIFPGHMDYVFERHYSCYSPSGDSLFSFLNQSHGFPGDYYTALSIEDGLFWSDYFPIWRFNLSRDSVLWMVYQGDREPTTKYAMEFLGIENNIATFRNYLERYNGDKEQHEYNIDIETGQVL